MIEIGLAKINVQGTSIEPTIATCIMKPLLLCLELSGMNSKCGAHAVNYTLSLVCSKQPSTYKLGSLQCGYYY